MRRTARAVGDSPWFFKILLAILILAFPILTWIWRSRLGVIFFALAADDFHRTLYAWEVFRQGHLVPSDLWPPLQFWIEAIVLRFWPNTLVVPGLVNVIASTGTLAMLTWLGRNLGLGKLGLVLNVALAATLPWFVWLSLSGLSEPLYIFFVTLAYGGVIAWSKTGRRNGLWLASLGLLAAGMLRFDGWGDSLVFSAGIVVLAWKLPLRQKLIYWLIAMVPWFFPCAWLVRQYVTYGNPVWYANVIRQAWLAAYGPSPLWVRLGWQLGDLFVVANVTLLAAGAGARLLRHHRGMLFCLSMWAGSLLLLIGSTITYTIAQANPTRLIVVHAILLLPCSALFLERLFQRTTRLAIVTTVVLAALVGGRLVQLPHYPNGLPNDIGQVGSYIRDAQKTGKIDSHAHILLEVTFWDYVILPVLVGNPDLVLYDRKPLGNYTFDDALNPSVLGLPPKQLRSELEQLDVRIAVVYSEPAADKLRAFAQESLKTGEYSIFLLPRIVEASGE